MIRLLQCGQQMHTPRQDYNNILIRNFYMFWASLAYYQEVLSCIKQLPNPSVITSVQNCRKFVSV